MVRIFFIEFINFYRVWVWKIRNLIRGAPAIWVHNMQKEEILITFPFDSNGKPKQSNLLWRYCIVLIPSIAAKVLPVIVPTAQDGDRWTSQARPSTSAVLFVHNKELHYHVISNLISALPNHKVAKFSLQLKVATSYIPSIGLSWKSRNLLLFFPIFSLNHLFHRQLIAALELCDTAVTLVAVIWYTLIWKINNTHLWPKKPKVYTLDW